MTSPFKRAFQYVWLIVTSMAFLVLASPFFLPDEILRSTARWFQLSHHPGPTCSLCGMTRAFLAISQGDFSYAMQLNRGALPFYGILVVMVLSTALYILRQWFEFRRMPLRESRQFHSTLQL